MRGGKRSSFLIFGGLFAVRADFLRAGALLNSQAGGWVVRLTPKRVAAARSRVLQNAMRRRALESAAPERGWVE